MHLSGIAAEDSPAKETSLPVYFLPFREPFRLLDVELAKGFEPPTL